VTPADETRFIALWTAGTETAEIAQQLGIPRGTVGSRAHTLQRQGKIQPRPKGGNYPRQRRTRPTLPLSDTTETGPVQTLVQNRADPSPERMHPPGASGTYRAGPTVCTARCRAEPPDPRRADIRALEYLARSNDSNRFLWQRLWQASHGCLYTSALHGRLNAANSRRILTRSGWFICNRATVTRPCAVIPTISNGCCSDH
jgi:hypothetical protein